MVTCRAQAVQTAAPEVAAENGKAAAADPTYGTNDLSKASRFWVQQQGESIY